MLEPKDYIVPDKLSISNNYLVFYDKNHPLARSNGEVPYHRHVAAVKAGRWITSEEIVHHKDENKLNAAPDNLEIVNAVTHCLLHHPRKEYTCKGCGGKFYRANNNATKRYCSQSCPKVIRPGYIGITKINWPPPAEMQKMVWRKPTRLIAKYIGVSDKAIEKFLKKHKLSKPKRGYWAKVAAGHIVLNQIPLDSLS